MQQDYNSQERSLSTHPRLKDLKVSPNASVYFTQFEYVPKVWFRLNKEKWEWTPYDPAQRYDGSTQFWFPVNITIIPEGARRGELIDYQNRAIFAELLEMQEELAMPNLFTLTYGTKIQIARKNGYKQFVPTNASAALDSILEDIKLGWMPNRPVVIALFGSPGTGKNEIVRRFAEQLWQFFVQRKGIQNFTKFPNFFKEHNFATLPNKEAISKFVGTSRGIEGGKGDLVIDLNKRAQVFYLGEFEKADPTIIKAFGGLFEDGQITDNSGAYAQCTLPTFFFISGNYSSEEQESLAKTIIELPAFLRTNDQSQIEDVDVRKQWEEFKRISFLGNLGFIGDRCYLTLLTYQPKSLDFCIGIATKFLHDAAAQIDRGFLIAWRPNLVLHYAKKILQSDFSNRDWRNKILRDMLQSLRRIHREIQSQTQTLQNKIVIFSAEGHFEVFRVTKEMKEIAESPLVREKCTPQTRAEIERAAIVQENHQGIMISSRNGEMYISGNKSQGKRDILVPTLLGMLIVILLIIAAQIFSKNNF